MAEELVLICAVDVVKCRLINLQSQPLSNDPAEELKIRHMFRYHRSLIKSTFFFQLVSRSCNVLERQRMQIWLTSFTVGVITVMV